MCSIARLERSVVVPWFTASRTDRATGLNCGTRVGGQRRSPGYEAVGCATGHRQRPLRAGGRGRQRDGAWCTVRGRAMAGNGDSGRKARGRYGGGVAAGCHGGNESTARVTRYRQDANGLRRTCVPFPGRRHRINRRCKGRGRSASPATTAAGGGSMAAAAGAGRPELLGAGT